MCAACLIGSHDFAHSGIVHPCAIYSGNHNPIRARPCRQPGFLRITMEISTEEKDTTDDFLAYTKHFSFTDRYTVVNSAISLTPTDQNEGFWRFSFLVLTLYTKVYFNFQSFLLWNEAGTLLVQNFRLSNLIFFQLRFTVGNYSPLS